MCVYNFLEGKLFIMDDLVILLCLIPKSIRFSYLSSNFKIMVDPFGVKPSYELHK